MSAKVLSNLESLGDMIGALQGLSDGMDSDLYMEAIIKQAHGRAANAFNVAAAATGATGGLSHVFEFGVPGITPGQTKYPDPTSPAARLWQHQISGHAGQQDIRFSFRPALNRNPQPTTASTGVSSKYLQKLSQRKYIFWNKAFVMETGQTVEINAHHGDFLFVPFGREGSRNPLNKKGFVMWNTKKLGPISAVPGRHVQGNFTKFWMMWWASAGQDMMEMDMRKSVEVDTARAEAEIAKRAKAEAMKPASATNITGAVAASRSWMKSLFGAFRKFEGETT